MDKICSKCVMDTTDKEIVFDERGICNHCHQFEVKKENLRPYSELLRIFNKIKMENIKKEFDCVIGISGGVDSSYVTYQAFKHGLRAMLIHCDNGQNAPEADENIKSMAKYTQFPLITVTLDEQEFKEIIKAYLRAGVPDLEVATDHSITASVCIQAIKTKTKYLLSGSNIASEGVMPETWAYLKQDSTNIKDIYEKFGNGKRLEHFPFFSYYSRKWHEDVVKDLRIIKILNYLSYDKEKAKKELIADCGWKDYGGKHCESVWTRFFQDYILPVRFNIDTRKAYYSALINMGQMDRDEALKRLSKPAYTPSQMKKDKAKVLSWLEMDEDEFDSLMRQPKRMHIDFKNNQNVAKLYMKVKKLI